MAKLGPDETIATVWNKLTHPQDYISGVSQQLYKCFALHGNATVCIGVSGKGVKPCYRVAYSKDDASHVFGSWWDNHDSLSKTDAASANWSTRAMSFAEVSKLMQRNFKPPAIRR
ncbi:MAG: hypothetical protein ACRCTD_06355 [Beijerinckiaceae bacterium]